MNENEKKVVLENNIEENKLSIPVALIIVGILIAGALFFGLRSNGVPTTVDKIQPQTAKQQPNNQTVDISKVKTEGQPFIGNSNAPVTMAYWADYQCPFCKRFDGDAITQ